MDNRDWDIKNYYLGDSVSLPLAFTDDAGTAIDLTGYTFYLTLKYDEKDLDEDAVISVRVTPDQLVNPQFGSVTITFETAGLSAKNYFYDVRYKKPDGTIATALNGKFNLHPAITQETA